MIKSTIAKYQQQYSNNNYYIYLLNTLRYKVLHIGGEEGDIVGGASYL